MVIKTKISSLLSILLVFMCSACSESKQVENGESMGDINAQQIGQKMQVKIILGSTRKGRTSDKIAQELKLMADKRSDISTEILDLNDFNLPFFNEEVPPARRENITDPVIQRWSDAISEGDAFIIVVPEYNYGYPGVLKNALDSLYKEWNDKPVAFVGYSGGPAGGANAIAQLRQVAKGFKMIPVEGDILIPSAWKAFDTKGKLAHQDIENELNTMIDQLKNSKK